MAMKLAMVYAGILLLGLVLLIIGALIEPARPAISQNGESLIALGLAFLLIGVGFFLAWANATRRVSRAYRSSGRKWSKTSGSLRPARLGFRVGLGPAAPAQKADARWA